MCGLCSSDPEERQRERRDCIATADALEQLAEHYRDLGSGTVNPHSDDAKIVGFAARNIVRLLVMEWV